MIKFIGSCLLIFTCQFVFSKTWFVGPSRTYTTPFAVSSIIQNGDTILIDSAVYVDVKQTTFNKNNLYIKGINGRPKLEAGATILADNTNGKGIFVIQGSNCKIENIEFANCKVKSFNGAGIRQEGSNVLVKNCYFNGNEMGLLCGVIANCTIIMEHNLFANNGSPSNPGFQHNVYIGNIDSFIFRYNYSKDAIAEGHELKSRAKYNFILYNRLSNENTIDSRTIDLPNGGTSIILGNIIEQGNNTSNNNILGYGLEGLSNAAFHRLYIVNNTFINRKINNGNFIQIQAGTDSLIVKNNLFIGTNTGGTIVGNANNLDSSNNLNIANINNAGFINANNFDYHLSSNSIGINKGINLNKKILGYTLIPNKEYMYDMKWKTRTISGIIDIGAFEWNINARIKTINRLKFYYDKECLYFSEPIQKIWIFDTNGKLILAQPNVCSTLTFNPKKQGIYFLRIENKQGCFQGKMSVGF